MDFVELIKTKDAATKKFLFKHVILLNETNAMGGVAYFANFVKWQGMAREMILRQSPYFKELIIQPIDMITHSCSVKFLGHLYFGDIVRIEVQTKNILPASFVLIFHYYNNETDNLVGTGEQRVTFSERSSGQLCRMPEALVHLAKEVEIPEK